MSASPVPIGLNGRDEKGRFVKGNSGGPGNPNIRRLNQWRRAVSNTVTAKDLREVVKVLIARAKAGEPWAVRELLDRTIGKPQQPLAIRPVDPLDEEEHSGMLTPTEQMDWLKEIEGTPEQPGGTGTIAPAPE